MLTLNLFVTVAYQYQGDELIAKDASQVAAEMELVKIDGKADTYYIKIGDQYLYNPSKATCTFIYIYS